mgnify:CR=1 FL=1
MRDRYFEQTIREARAGAKIVLWPEGAGVGLEEDEAALIEQRRREEAEREKLAFEHAAASALAGTAEADEEQQAAQPAAPQPFTRQQPKVGRNEPCPCGSGKKYKQCHGALQ